MPHTASIYYITENTSFYLFLKLVNHYPLLWLLLLLLFLKQLQLTITIISKNVIILLYLTTIHYYLPAVTMTLSCLATLVCEHVFTYEMCNNIDTELSWNVVGFFYAYIIVENVLNSLTRAFFTTAQTPHDWISNDGRIMFCGKGNVFGVMQNSVFCDFTCRTLCENAFTQHAGMQILFELQSKIK